MSLPEQVERLNEELKKYDQSLEKTGKESSDQAPRTQNEQPKSDSQPPSEGEGWENKFRVLQGKYNKEVPALTAQVRELQRLVDSLRDENASLKNSQSQSPQQPEGLSADGNAGHFADEIDPRQYEEFGDEIVSLAESYRRQGRTIEQLEGELKRLSQEVGGVRETQAQSEEQRFIEQLESRLPNVLTLNEDPECIRWLDENGLLPSLQAAGSEGDVERTARIFELFLNRTGNSEPASTPPSDSSELSLHEHQVPQVSAGDGSPSEQPSFTPDQVNQFYRSWSRGLPFEFNGVLVSTRAEAEKIDNEITLASAQGRV